MANENNFRLKQVAATLQLGKSGPILKKISSALGVRNSSDSAYANLKALDPVGNNDYITKLWASQNIGSLGGSYMSNQPSTDVQVLPSTIPIGATYVYDKKSPFFGFQDLRIAPANGHKILFNGRLIEGTGAAADGPELVVNGTFNTNLTGWTVNGAFWDAGRVRVEGATGRQAEQGIPTVIGKRYKVSIGFQNTTNPTADAAHITVYGGPNSTGAVVRSNLGAFGVNNIGAIEFEFIALTTTSYLYLSTQDGNDVVHYDNVSVKLAGTGYIHLKNPWKGFSLTGINSTTWALTSDALIDKEVSLVGRSTWLNKTVIPVAKNQCSGFELNGFGYVVGGMDDSSVTSSQNYRYDDLSETWSLREAMPNTIRYPSAITLNGFGYAMLGNITSSSTPTNTNNRFNDKTGSFESRSSTGVTARSYPGGFTIDGLGYVFGGGIVASPFYSNSAWSYSDSTDSFTSLANMLSIRGYQFRFEIDGYGYTCGGSAGGSSLQTTEQYQSKANVWVTKRSMFSNREGGFFNAHNQRGHHISGSNGVSPQVDNNQYNPFTNTWEFRELITTGVYYGASFTQNGNIYAASGVISLVSNLNQQFN